MYLFFRTIENRLQSIFHGVLAAQSGWVARRNYTNEQSSEIVQSIPTALMAFGK